jgi:hypothetical protein
MPLGTLVVVLDHVLLDGVADLLDVDLGRLHLRLLELLEDAHADRARDEADDRQHDHDLEECETRAGRPAHRPGHRSFCHTSLGHRTASRAFVIE